MPEHNLNESRTEGPNESRTEGPNEATEQSQNEARTKLDSFIARKHILSCKIKKPINHYLIEFRLHGTTGVSVQ